MTVVRPPEFLFGNLDGPLPALVGVERREYTRPDSPRLPSAECLSHREDTAAKRRQSPPNAGTAPTIVPSSSTSSRTTSAFHPTPSRTVSWLFPWCPASTTPDVSRRRSSGSSNDETVEVRVLLETPTTRYRSDVDVPAELLRHIVEQGSDFEVMPVSARPS